MLWFVSFFCLVEAQLLNLMFLPIKDSMTFLGMHFLLRTTWPQFSSNRSQKIPSYFEQVCRIRNLTKNKGRSFILITKFFFFKELYRSQIKRTKTSMGRTILWSKLIELFSLIAWGRWVISFQLWYLRLVFLGNALAIPSSLSVHLYIYFCSLTLQFWIQVFSSKRGTPLFFSF